ncbi:MAG: alpha/beta hydrolase [Pseudomonadota bacterium]
MRRALMVVIVLLLTACSNRHLGKPVAAAPVSVLSSYEITRDVVVTPPDWPQKLLADVYRPAGAGPFPSVLLIHGGAWKRGDRAQVKSLAERIAARGYLVVNTTYRLVPQYVWPAQLHDVQQAVRWMRSEEGVRLGIDGNRIGTFGYSAGGHLAALLGALSDEPKWGDAQTRIKAVVAGGDPADLPAFKDGRLVPAFIGASWEENPQAYRDASPIYHISAGDPPVFAYHARYDMLVPFDQATRYKEALDKAGITNELFVIGGHGHISGFFADGDAVEASLTFLDRYLR